MPAHPSLETRVDPDVSSRRKRVIPQPLHEVLTVQVGAHGVGAQGPQPQIMQEPKYPAPPAAITGSDPPARPSSLTMPSTTHPLIIDVRRMLPPHAHCAQLLVRRSYGGVRIRSVSLDGEDVVRCLAAARAGAPHVDTCLRADAAQVAPPPPSSSSSTFSVTVYCQTSQLQCRLDAPPVAVCTLDPFAGVVTHHFKRSLRFTANAVFFAVVRRRQCVMLPEALSTPAMRRVGADARSSPRAAVAGTRRQREQEEPQASAATAVPRNDAVSTVAAAAPGASAAAVAAAAPRIQRMRIHLNGEYYINVRATDLDEVGDRLRRYDGGKKHHHHQRARSRDISDPFPRDQIIDDFRNVIGQLTADRSNVRTLSGLEKLAMRRGRGHGRGQSEEDDDDEDDEDYSDSHEDGDDEGDGDDDIFEGDDSVSHEDHDDEEDDDDYEHSYGSWDE